jgi:hypothetical protein
MKHSSKRRRGEYLIWYTLFSFLLFSAWEWYQTPFFIDISQEINTIVWYRFHCTVGDMMILTTTVILTSLLFRDLQWLFHPTRKHYLIVSIMGLSYTMFSEYRNVYIVNSWSYSPLMPKVFGIGMLPIVQWILLPSMILYIVKRVQSADS